MITFSLRRIAIVTATLGPMVLGCDATGTAANAVLGGNGGGGGVSTASETGGTGVGGVGTGGNTQPGNGVAGTGGGGNDETNALPLCDPSRENDFVLGWLPEMSTPSAPMVAGDSVQDTNEMTCQPVSGCKTFRVIRDARTNEILWAELHHDIGQLERFASMVGFGMSLESQCRIVPAFWCFENEAQIYQRLLVQGDDVAYVEHGTHVAITIQGRPYTVWFVEGLAISGGQSRCLDAGSFWRGGVKVFVTR